jgi:hypothetical protein
MDRIPSPQSGKALYQRHTDSLQSRTAEIPEHTKVTSINLFELIYQLSLQQALLRDPQLVRLLDLYNLRRVSSDDSECFGR